MFTSIRTALIAAVALFALASPAAARTVHCGEVITSDTRVSNDLRCPTPVALEIGADGVELDLRGHTIQAIEFVDENENSYDDGIALLIAGYDDVSVKNGTLIAPVTLGAGLWATEADGLSLSRVTTRGYASLLVRGDAARIRRVTANGFASRVVSDGATIDRLTTFSELDVVGRAVEVTRGEFHSIAGFSVDGSSLERSTFLQGLLLWPGSNGNVISGNVFMGGGDGVSVPEGATDNQLIRNSASGGEDDGIDVDEPSTTLIGNRAFDNGDLGIEAVAGVTDGGGNRAFGNGNPLQCLNVDCDA